MQTPEKYKVAIIGGGPAGSFCALGLDKTRFDITLIDKKIFPRDKTCGDALSIDALDAIHRFDPTLMADMEREQIVYPVPRIEVHSGKNRLVTVNMDNGKNAAIPRISKRFEFDSFLNRRLLRDGQVRFVQQKVRAVSRKGGRSSVQFENGDEIGVDFVVFANGSKTIANPFLEHKIETQNFYGIRQYIRNETLDGDRMYFFLTEDKLPTYFWAFPTAKNEFNVGIYFKAGHKNEAWSPKPGKNVLEYIQRHPHIAQLFKNSTELSRPQAYHIPYNHRMDDNLVGKNYVVLGAAAGFADPLTGEGIGHALKSGIIAAEMLNGITGPEIDPALQKRFLQKIRTDIMDKAAQSYRLQRMLSHAFLCKIAFLLIQKTVFRNLFYRLNHIRQKLLNV